MRPYFDKNPVAFTIESFDAGRESDCPPDMVHPVVGGGYFIAYRLSGQV
jgi:hypothetical protein